MFFFSLQGKCLLQVNLGFIKYGWSTATFPSAHLRCVLDQLEKIVGRFFFHPRDDQQIGFDRFEVVPGERLVPWNLRKQFIKQDRQADVDEENEHDHLLPRKPVLER